MCGECIEWALVTELQDGATYYRHEEPVSNCKGIWVGKKQRKGEIEKRVGPVWPYLLVEECEEPVPSSILEGQPNLSMVAFCRFLLVLLKHGYDSDIVQAWLAGDAFRRVIVSVCRDHSLSILKGTFTPLSWDVLRELFSPATYSNKTTWETFLTKSEADDEPFKLLLTYEYWLERRQEHRYKDFEIVYPVIVFSIASRIADLRNHQLYHTIRTREPIYAAPLPTGDLWLRRIVSLDYATENGLDVLLPYDGTIAPSVMWYLAVKMQLSKSERGRIASSMRVFADRLGEGLEYDLLDAIKELEDIRG